MAIRHVPFQSPMFESDGRMSRIWVLFFQGLTEAIGVASTLAVDLVDGPGTTNITSATDATDGAVLAVTITQSAVGGRQITWSSQFASDTSPDIPLLPNSVIKKIFVGRPDGKWHEFSQLG